MNWEAHYFLANCLVKLIIFDGTGSAAVREITDAYTTTLEGQVKRNEIHAWEEGKEGDGMKREARDGSGTAECDRARGRNCLGGIGAVGNFLIF
jgi:hypothetical protein